MNLNVNIDHIATLRQARGGSEPDPILAALKSELAGATGIVAHLREDRRHVQDRDIRLLRDTIQTKLDLEMAATDEIVEIALDIIPELVTIVPEKRLELTTEGGLDIILEKEKYRILCDKMHQKNIEVSFFVEPDINQIEVCKEIGADMVELHTGHYANAKIEIELKKHLEMIQNSANYAHSIGLYVAAGHGLNYSNTQAIARIDSIRELSIGHSIISRAAFVGITNAVKDMLSIIQYENLRASIK